MEAQIPKARKKKKKKKSHPVLDYVVYLLVRVVAVFLQLRDVDSSLRVARWLGRALYRVDRRHRELAKTQLAESYPDKDARWVEKTAQRSFEHLVMFAFDVLYMQRLIRPSTWRRYVELGDLSEPLGVVLDGRGAVMITGHYGNFEVLGYALATFGMETYNIARPIDNAYINRYVYEQLHKGQTIIYKKGASQMMHRVLTSGGALGIVADQNGSRKDIFVDFFGRKAATYKSIALMAMEYNVPIVVACARRIGDKFRFAICISRVIYPSEWQSKNDPITWITAEYTSSIEDFIRQDPEQYWWLHRRWKTRPPERRRSAKLAVDTYAP